jgi:hypothetical protein
MVSFKSLNESYHMLGSHNQNKVDPKFLGAFEKYKHKLPRKNLTI